MPYTFKTADVNIHDLARKNKAIGHHYFSDNAMSFFGDTIASFAFKWAIDSEGNKTLIMHRKPSAKVNIFGSIEVAGTVCMHPRAVELTEDGQPTGKLNRCHLGIGDQLKTQPLTFLNGLAQKEVA